MKRFEVITFKVILFLHLLIFSCKKEKSQNTIPNISALNLSETIWEGRLLLQSTENPQSIDIRISFKDKARGEYAIAEKYKPIFSNYSLNTTLSYAKKDKIIFFEGGYNNVLLGDWWLQKADENALVLYRNNGSKSDSLNIKKIN